MPGRPPHFPCCRLLSFLLLCLVFVYTLLPPRLPLRLPPPAAFLSGPACPLQDPLRLSLVFSGADLVLECAPAIARVWGWASPGCAISVEGLPGRAAVSYDDSGLFIAALTLPCSTRALALTLRSSSGASLNLTARGGRVLFCTGQSNAVGLNTQPGLESDSSVAASLQVETPATAAEAQLPLPLYGLRVGMHDPWALDAPLADLATAPELPWSALATAAQAAPFSAVCWWAGRELAARLGGGVPVGMVESAWGGSWLQAWSTPQDLAACAAPPFGAAWAPAHFSSLHNSMLAPFAVGPMALSGLLFYQGESNAIVSQAEYYRCGLAAAVRTWRGLFSATPLPPLFVGIVELAPFARNPQGWGGGWVGVRAAQLAVALDPALPPPLALTPTADCRDPPGDIHPRCKRVMGVRLGQSLAAALGGGGRGSAAAARRFTGPAYSHAQAGPGEGAVTVFFKAGGADASAGVRWVEDALACQGVDAAACAGAQVLQGGEWVAATGAAAEGGRGIVLRSSRGREGGAITATRYAWGMWPAVNIVSAGEGGWPCHPWEEFFK